MKIQDILLVSDIDGTLIDKNHQIPTRNREAICRFMQKGGGFAIATGRSWESVEKCLDGLKVNRPCVLANGGVVFDMQTRRALSCQPLPAEAIEYTRRFLKAFPEAGVEVFTPSDVLMLRENQVTRDHMRHERLQYQTAKIEEITEPWCKVLIASTEQPALMEFTRSFPHPGVRFVASSDRYWEMLPEGADKGTGIARLAEVCGVPMSAVAAIGDYYNDVEMLQTAGIPAVPANAPEEIQKLAKWITCSCEEGAVAEFIEILERMYG